MIKDQILPTHLLLLLVHTTLPLPASFHNIFTITTTSCFSNNFILPIQQRPYLATMEQTLHIPKTRQHQLHPQRHTMVQRNRKPAYNFTGLALDKPTDQQTDTKSGSLVAGRRHHERGSYEVAFYIIRGNVVGRQGEFDCSSTDSSASVVENPYKEVLSPSAKDTISQWLTSLESPTRGSPTSIGDTESSQSSFGYYDESDQSTNVEDHVSAPAFLDNPSSSESNLPQLLRSIEREGYSDKDATLEAGIQAMELHHPIPLRGTMVYAVETIEKAASSVTLINGRNSCDTSSVDQHTGGSSRNTSKLFRRPAIWKRLRAEFRRRFRR